MLQDDCTLVTAGRSIQCWDVETRTVKATFTGHTTDVNHLLPVCSSGENSFRLTNGYFLSSADTDRCISAWYSSLDCFAVLHYYLHYLYLHMNLVSLIY